MYDVMLCFEARFHRDLGSGFRAEKVCRVQGFGDGVQVWANMGLEVRV